MNCIQRSRISMVSSKSEASSEIIGLGTVRRRLLDPARIKGSSIFLDHWYLGPNATCDVVAPRSSFVWFFVLEGEGSLRHSDGVLSIAAVHTGCLTPGFAGTLESPAGMALIHVEIPNAHRFDSGFANEPPVTRVIDWTREPVLNSKNDSRKRIYLATSQLLRSKVMRAEIIQYPPRTSGSSHFHEGAEHFKFVVRGRGTGYANEVPHEIHAGDLIWHPSGERHYSTTSNSDGMEFIEFFAPSEFGTIWVNPERQSLWLPTGENLRGEVAKRQTD
jgi:quercetin dioxygenase-like cupin family protein